MSDGVLEEVDGRWRLRFDRRIAHPPGRLWRALTEPEHLAAWFPTGIEGDRTAGAMLTFPFPEQAFPAMDGVMLACEPPSLLEFTWGGDTLRFEVSPDGDGSRLRLIVWLDERGKAVRDGAGWHECLDVLQAHLDGRPAGRPGARWQELAAVYRQAFGPEAATVGPPEGWEPPAG